MTFQTTLHGSPKTLFILRDPIIPNMRTVVYTLPTNNAYIYSLMMLANVSSYNPTYSWRKEDECRRNEGDTPIIS